MNPRPEHARARLVAAPQEVATERAAGPGRMKLPRAVARLYLSKPGCVALALRCNGTVTHVGYARRYWPLVF